VARSSLPAATLARWRSICAGVAYPALTSPARIWFTVAVSSRSHAGEVIGKNASPQRAYAIHDGLLNARGLAGLENWLKIAAEPVGGTFTRLAPGTSVDL
jgi:hypothetical protein